jgi:hypothetical protein
MTLIPPLLSPSTELRRSQNIGFENDTPAIETFVAELDGKGKQL